MLIPVIYPKVHGISERISKVRKKKVNKSKKWCNRRNSVFGPFY